MYLPFITRSSDFSKRPPRSLLILRFSSIGDLILTTATIEALALYWPKTRIFFAVKKNMASLLENNPYITEIIALGPREGLLHFARRLAKRKPQAILDLHNKLRSKLLRLIFCRTPSVVWKHRTLRDRLPLPLSFKNYRSRYPLAKHYRQAAEKLVAKPLESGLIRYVPTEKEKKEASEIMKAARLDLNRPIIGVATGAGWQTKAWPLSYFIELISKAQENKLQVALIGGQAELEEAEKIRKSLKQQDGVIDLCALPLRLSAAVISYCRVFVANDTGPMHMARGQGVPTLAIFGCTDPMMFDFRGHILAYNKQKCSPCCFVGRSTCPRKHFRCMRELYPAELWESLKILLKRKKAPYLQC